MKLEIPNSIEAEKSVIGSMFLSKYASRPRFRNFKC